MSKEIVDDIMEYCSSNGRICPMPQEWNKLWKMLPDRVRDGAGWTPSMPLILGSWHESTPDMKMERLEEHIQWAVKHHAIVPVVGFLYVLAEDDWLHIDES